MPRGPPRHHSNPFLVPGNPRPERAPRFPPQKPGRQPIANIPQAVPVKSSKPLVPTGKSLAQALKENEHFSTLYTALKAADLITTLEKTNTDYTIFAPTNAAFDKVSYCPLVKCKKTHQASGLSNAVVFPHVCILREITEILITSVDVLSHGETV